MSGDEARRAAMDEAISRDANELAEGLGTAWKGRSDALDIRCECSRPDCRATIRVSLGEYESVRQDARHFLLVAGHVDPAIDRVIGSIREYALVEKVGPAADVAEETDPRA